MNRIELRFPKKKIVPADMPAKKGTRIPTFEEMKERNLSDLVKEYESEEDYKSKAFKTATVLNDALWLADIIFNGEQ